MCSFSLEMFKSTQRKCQYTVNSEKKSYSLLSGNGVNISLLSVILADVDDHKGKYVDTEFGYSQ